MATTHISIDVTASGGKGQELNQAISQQEMARDTLVRLKAQMETMIDGDDHSLLEAKFGIATGQGETVYNLVAGAVLTLAEDADLVQLINRLG